MLASKLIVSIVDDKSFFINIPINESSSSTIKYELPGSMLLKLILKIFLPDFLIKHGSLWLILHHNEQRICISVQT